MHGLSTILFPVFFASQVLAHGFVYQVIIGGRTYIGNPPAESMKKGPSIVRQIANTLPVKGTDNPFLACGSGATAGSLVADAQPGDTLGFVWKGAQLAPWPHVAGPIITYMASCGSASCDNFDPKNAQWFKISHLAKKSDGLWYMDDVQKGKAIQVQIPSTLAPGNYLVRQEIIALHIAMAKGGVEFYPSCTQLRVGGSQTGKPDPSDLVTFPGAYRDEDPGLFVPGIFQPGFKYTLPGPPIARIAKGNAAPVINAPQQLTSKTSTKPTSSTFSHVQPTSTGDAAEPKPPASGNTSPTVQPPRPTTFRKCTRRRSPLKSASEKVKRAEPATRCPTAVPQVVPPSRSRHFKRALSRHDSRH